jgi:Matrixin
MNAKKSTLMFVVVAITVLALVAFPSSAYANHSWGGYHWGRTSNAEFTLKMGDNVSGLWDGMFTTALSDWSQSTVLNLTKVTGGTTPKQCKPTSGRVEVCSADYGGQQWLGVAQIWLSSGHIVQGTVKNNDHYFGNSTYRYNNTAEMQHVICQEIGHTFGLDHQDESGALYYTCMDYYHNTSNSDTVSTHPNQGDYDELMCIYDTTKNGQTLTYSPPGKPGHTCRGTGHLDSSTTIGAAATSMPNEMANGDFSSPNSWGKLVSSNAQESTYVRDFGNGHQVVTFVIWAKE